MRVLRHAKNERSTAMMDNRNALREAGDWMAEAGNITMHKAQVLSGLYDGPTWNRQGLHDLAETSVALFTAKTGVPLPYNCATWGPYVGHSWHRNRIVRDKAGDRIIEETARFTGWLKAASEMPGLARWIGQVTSTRGQNSPYTMVDIWSVARNNPSPGHFYRQLCKVRWRANQILSPFGLSVSRQSMAMVAGNGLKRVGKTAYKAAADTIQFYLRRKFNLWDFGQGMRARQILESARGLREFICQPKHIQAWASDAVTSGRFANLQEALETVVDVIVEDHTDDITLWLDYSQREVVDIGTGTMEVVPGWDRYGESQCLVRGFGRSHRARGWHGTKGNDDNDHLLLCEWVLQAWRRQDEVMEREAGLLSKLRFPDRTILVAPKDFEGVGNCQPGTSDWMRRHGVSEKGYAPMSVLFSSVEDPRVRRVLELVANQVAA